MNATLYFSRYVFRFLNSAPTQTTATQAVQRAHARIVNRSIQPDSTLFTWRFLQEEGADIVRDYIDGKLVRHRAAEALAHAWNTDLGNISAQQRRYRIASTAMAADLFFMELTQELNRQ